MKRIWICGMIISLVVFSNVCSADEVTVSGSVTDDADGSGISDAVVMFISDSGDTTSTVTDANGDYEVFLTLPTVSVDERPVAVALSQNYPNPFNPSTTIEYSLDHAGFVSLTVYNVMGQVVRTLVNEYRGTGTHSVVWNGMDSNGQSVAAGVYVYRLQAGDSVQSKKMLLIDGGGAVNAFTGSGALKQARVSSQSASVETHFVMAVKKDGFVTYEDYWLVIAFDTNINIILQQKSGATLYGTIYYHPCVECNTDNWNGIIDPITIFVYDTNDYTESLAEVVINYPDTTFEVTGLPEAVVDIVIQGDDIIPKKIIEIPIIEGDNDFCDYSLGYCRMPLSILYNLDTSVTIYLSENEFMLFLKTPFENMQIAETIVAEYDCNIRSFNDWNAFGASFFTCHKNEENDIKIAHIIQNLHNDQRVNYASIEAYYF